MVCGARERRLDAERISERGRGGLFDAHIRLGSDYGRMSIGAVLKENSTLMTMQI